MALRIVENASKFEPGGDRGVIVVESSYGPGQFDKAFQELAEGMEARKLALSYAGARGMASPTQNGNTEGPYPVDASGTPLDMLKDEKGEQLPQTDPKMQPARYRVGVPVTRPIR